MGILVLVECVVELEIDVLDILGYAVYPDLGFVDHNSWVGGAYAIYDTCLILLVKERSFADIDANVHLSRTNMVKRSPNIFLIFCHKLLEIDIDLTLSRGLVLSLAICLIDLHGLHLGSPLLPLLFNFLNAFHFEFNLLN